jgi:hypothetical protein
MSPSSLFREIKAALDAEDIEGLLELKCPLDEYDGEAPLIESELAKAKDFGKKHIRQEQLEGIIARVWNDRFGPFADKELSQRAQALASVARKLGA